MCRWYCSNLPNGTSTQPSTTGAAQNREATGYFLARADRDDVASSRSRRRRPAIDTTPGGSAKWSKNQSFRPQGAYMRHSPPLAGPGLPDWEAVDAAISDGAEASFEFLERLVASPSTVGRELPAQRIVAAELDRRLRGERAEHPAGDRGAGIRRRGSGRLRRPSGRAGSAQP